MASQSRFTQFLNRFRPWQSQEASVARDPKKVTIQKLGQAISSGQSGFEDSPIDLAEISAAYHTDAYIKRAVDKYADLMFKSGWRLSGSNNDSLTYVNTRLRLMEEATQISTDQLFYQFGFDMVLFGNGYLIKARQNTKSSVPGIQAVGYTGNKPIAGYFPLAPTTVTVSRDANGTVLGYQQTSSTGTATPYNTADIIHLPYKRPTGRAYGIPFVYDVLDDVKILRQIEENVARLVYRNLFPLYQYKVGLSSPPGMGARDEEIAEVKDDVQNMPMDGAIVTSERHDIKAISQQGNALDASSYLKYFRERVFTGLGVSASIMGISDTSNKSTSDNQASDLFDGVKDFQRVFTEIVQHQIINELLYEGGYDPVLNPEDRVNFEFVEIDTDSQIKKENHAVQLYTQNVINFDEVRNDLGRTPVSDDLSRFFFKLVNNPSATAAAQNTSNNIDQPTNQNGTQGAPNTRSSTDLSKNLTEFNESVNLTSELLVDEYYSSLKRNWENLQNDLVESFKKKSSNYARNLSFEMVRRSLKQRGHKYIEHALTQGHNELLKETKKSSTPMSASFMNLAINRINHSTDESIDKLTNDMIYLVNQVEKKEDPITYLLSAFESNIYRLKLISQAEIYKAYNYGRAVTAKSLGYRYVQAEYSEGACTACEEKSHKLVDLNQPNLFESLPPHHPQCVCIVHTKGYKKAGESKS